MLDCSTVRDFKEATTDEYMANTAHQIVAL